MICWYEVADRQKIFSALAETFGLRGLTMDPAALRDLPDLLRSGEQGLIALITNPDIEGWSGPYIKKSKVPTDPWKSPFQYYSPGFHGDYDLFSYGKDNAPGGKSKNKVITNWE